ncbi:MULTISPECIES: type III secretion system stator protein SctL [unclassified Inquilinus]|uniref:type III secretion system stator protein SctL n=1 Tax=unclassified Inquilinus TaxID=2645927 RepID=UPI003F8F6EF8
MAETTPPGPAFRAGRPVLKAASLRQWHDATRFLAEAEAHAARLRAEADAAFADGKARGHAEGLAAGQQEAATLLTATGVQIDRYFAGLDQTLADLVQQTIERILGGFDRRELVLQAVAHGLRQARLDHAATLRVAPELVAALRDRLADPAQDLGDIARRVTVESDPGLAGDTCVMVTRYGHVELGIDAQLRALRDGLRRAGPGEAAP